MFCHNCGTQLDDNAKFCHKCGQGTEASSTGQQSKTADPQPVAAHVPSGVETAKKKSKKPLFIILGAVAAVVIIGVIVALNWSRTDYIASVKAHEPLKSQELNGTYEDVLGKYLDNPSWKDRDTDGQHFVDISGKIKGTDHNLTVSVKTTPDPNDDEILWMTPMSVVLDDKATYKDNDAKLFLAQMFKAYGENYNDLAGLLYETETPEEMKNKIKLSETYENKEDGYSFKYPKIWKDIKDEKVREEYDLMGLKTEDNEVAFCDPIENILFTISKEPDVSESVIQTIINDEAYMNSVYEDNEDIKDFKTSVVELNGMQARVCTYTTDYGVTQTYYFGNGNDEYLVSFCIPNYVPGDNKKLDAYASTVMASFKITPVKSASGIDLSQTYTNNQYGFSFKYPSAWRLVDEKEYAERTPDSDYIFVHREDSEYPLVYLVNEDETTPELNSSFIVVDMGYATQDDIDFYLGDDEQFKREHSGDGFIVNDAAVVKIDGVDARAYTWTNEYGLNGQSYVYFDGQKAYNISFAYGDEIIDNLQKYIDAIMDSYKITKPGSSASGAQAQNRNYKVGITIQSLENTYWAGVFAEVEKLLQQKGWEYSIIACNDDSATQAQQIDNFIKNDADLIMVHPSDPILLESSLKKARDAGIEVMVWDDIMENSDLNWVIDNYELGYDIGKAAADFISEHYTKSAPAKMVLINYPNTPILLDRENGIKDALKKNADGLYEIVGAFPGIDAQESLEGMEKVLQANPDVTVVCSIGAGGDIGANEAFMVMYDGKIPDNVGIFSADATEYQLENIKNGQASRATVGFEGSHKRTAEAVVDLYQRLLDGEKFTDPNIYRPFVTIDDVNVDTYLKDYQ